MPGDPDLFCLLVEDGELVGMLVLDIGTGGQFKEVGEECSINQIHGQGWGNYVYNGG